MLHLSKFQNAIIKHLNSLLIIPVYIHIPDDAELPFLHLHKILYNDWLLVPSGYQFNLTCSLYSNSNSSKEAILIIEQVRSDLLDFEIENYHVVKNSSSATRVSRMKDGIWCASVNFRSYLTIKN